MAGLELSKLVAAGKEADKEQRMLDIADASRTLTNLIAERWSQKKYEVQFQVDGDHFITFVKDHQDTALVPLEERSKGFQWFFSFDMQFMHDTSGKMENAVLLLDEPGLHLHAAAQRDLLKRMHAYADKNQLIYTTHLPFMIDLKRLDNIYVAEDVEKHGTKLHQNWAGANDDAKFTLQSALGLSWSQSLFVGPYNLVVEGVDDFWLLTTFSTLFEEAGEPGIDPRLVINPAGGASKVAYIGTILKAQELEVAVFLDSDFAGKSAFQQLVHEKILKHNRVVMLGDVIGKELCAIEDLFEEKYYIGKVNEAYKKELTDKLLKLNTHTSGKKTLVDRVEEGLKELNIETFNKGRVAKLIMSDLGSKKLSAVNPKTVENFRLVFSAINKLWKSPEK